MDRLAAHVELEEAIVSEIFTFQKVIDPLEQIYRAAYPAAGQDPELPALRGTLEELRREVLRRNAENRALLKRKMELVPSRDSRLPQSPLLALLRLRRQGEGSLVDIQG